MADGIPLVQVSNLYKHYVNHGRFSFNQFNCSRAVDGVSFSIPEGHIMGLIGESGCGKTTVGKTMLNLIHPTGGSVYFDGQCVFDVEGKKQLSAKQMTGMCRQMQIIFQDPYASLDPRKSVLQILREGIRKHKLLHKDQVKDRCVELLLQCGMDETTLWRFPHELSGGQRQRISIARALSVMPRFIVCDEPTAALDVSIQSQILNLMLDLKDSLSLTYLFISHNLGIVRNFCDSIAVMYLGKIVEAGPAAAVVENPLHPYSHVLISSIPKSHPDEQKERISLRGGVPGAMLVPSGCRFHTLCPNAIPKCAEKEPELIRRPDGRQIACHLSS